VQQKSGCFLPEHCIYRSVSLTYSEFNNTYLKALHLRRQLRQDLLRTFRIPHPLHPSHQTLADGIDVILHPTAIRTAPLLRPKSSSSYTGSDGQGISRDLGNRTSEYTQDLMTVPASLAGLPAMSVPSDRGEDRRPVGMSLMGQWGTEELLFWVGRAMESWKH